MTLDEIIINEAAISRAYEKIAIKNRERMKSGITTIEDPVKFKELAKDHNQIKEWLCELKYVRESFDKLRKDAEKHKKEIDHTRQCSKKAGIYEAISELKEWTRQQSLISRESLIVKLKEMEKEHEGP